jgi:hypothetical protein
MLYIDWTVQKLLCIEPDLLINKLLTKPKAAGVS